MTTLTVQGRLDSAPANTDFAKQTSPDLVVTPKYSPQLQIARAGVPLHTLEVSDDDVVELDLGGGIRLWMRVEQLQEDLNPTFRRSVTAPALVVPSTLPLGSPRRGVCLAFRKPLNQSRGIQRLPADLERIREPLIETHERPQEPLHTAPQHGANSPPGEPVYQELFDYRRRFWSDRFAHQGLNIFPSTTPAAILLLARRGLAVFLESLSLRGRDWLGVDKSAWRGG